MASILGKVFVAGAERAAVRGAEQAAEQAAEKAVAKKAGEGASSYAKRLAGDSFSHEDPLYINDEADAMAQQLQFAGIGGAAGGTALAVKEGYDLYHDPPGDCPPHYTCIQNKWAMDTGKAVTPHAVEATPHAVEAGAASPMVLSVALLLTFALALVLNRGRIMRYARPQRYQQPPESADLTENEDLLPA